MGILDGKRAVIVGASGGIGMACAEAFLAEGARVAGTYRRKSAALEELARRQERLALLPLDVGSVSQVTDCMKEAVRLLSGIDILVNAAGIHRPALLHAADPEEWGEAVAVNLMGAFHVTQSVILPMMRAGGGSIVEISSVYGERGGIGQSSYSAAKAGVLGLTRSAAVELASKKIRVNAIAPGFIDTAMTEGLSEKFRQQALTHIPMKRFGSPGEIAELAVFLAGPKSSYITGQVFVIDGGLSAV